MSDLVGQNPVQKIPHPLGGGGLRVGCGCSAPIGHFLQKPFLANYSVLSLFPGHPFWFYCVNLKKDDVVELCAFFYCLWPQFRRPKWQKIGKTKENKASLSQTAYPQNIHPYFTFYWVFCWQPLSFCFEDSSPSLVPTINMVRGVTRLMTSLKNCFFEMIHV